MYWNTGVENRRSDVKYGTVIFYIGFFIVRKRNESQGGNFFWQRL